MEIDQRIFNSFNHGLVSSKLWLCEELEKAILNSHIPNPILHILGSWDNLLAFMLVIRQPKMYGVINGYDINSDAISTANLICDTWKYDYPKVYNFQADVNSLDFRNVGKESVFINCSVDQFEDTNWYDVIPEGNIVCLQTTDIDNTNEPWFNKQHTKNTYELKHRYPVKDLLYLSNKPIQYRNFGFNRFMMIGVK